MLTVSGVKLTTETDIKFETYRGYLDAIRRQIYLTYGSWTNFGRKCVEQTRNIQGIGDFDHDWVERFLKIAWNTEFILSAGGHWLRQTGQGSL